VPNVADDPTTDAETVAPALIGAVGVLAPQPRLTGVRIVFVVTITSGVVMFLAPLGAVTDNVTSARTVGAVNDRLPPTVVGVAMDAATDAGRSVPVNSAIAAVAEGDVTVYDVAVPVGTEPLLSATIRLVPALTACDESRRVSPCPVGKVKALPEPSVPAMIDQAPLIAGVTDGIVCVVTDVASVPNVD
jgi:hypothetical protein